MSWYHKNQLRAAASMKRWAKLNPDKVRAIKDRWVKNNLEKRRKASREWNRRNRAKIRERTFWRYNSDPAFRILSVQRVRLRRALQGRLKLAKTIELIGCGPDELRNHIESLFKSGMSWANYGLWEVDHIKPCSSFNLAILEQQHKCFCFRNLQPLWKSENCKKGGIYLSR